MEISFRSCMAMLHGMLFGLFFLMAIYSILVELWAPVTPDRQTARRLPWERGYLVITAAVGWAAVLTGAYLVYPWYRALPPAGTTSLAAFPQFLLKSSARTAGWHSVGMEWKEHIAWFAPIAMTMVAYILTKYRQSMHLLPQVRAAVLRFTLAALFATAVAGFFGAMLNKNAPVQGGPVLHLMGESR